MTAAPATASAYYPYLTTARAKSEARNRAWNFNAKIEKVHVDWYNRWGPHEVHVGVTGSWTREVYHDGCEDGYYDGCSADSWTEDVESECSGSVTVRMHYSGAVSTRVPDKSCFYG